MNQQWSQDRQRPSGTYPSHRERLQISESSGQDAKTEPWYFLLDTPLRVMDKMEFAEASSVGASHTTSLIIVFSPFFGSSSSSHSSECKDEQNRLPFRGLAIRGKCPENIEMVSLCHPGWSTVA
ncbi:uncharacterized protein LOC117065987 [Trachypithecus francoisi]|uniref:uncharacterized protein LOC117065987 n=1 Tax=Trachypithecus francoisi TaxID=54180 RepID=UPI00141B7667|nr:uncharacterized protein LOC117065987 [Trachypithecus francoisi]